MTDHEFDATTARLAEIRARADLTAARADVLWLLAKVDRLTGERDRAQALADRLHEERLAVLAGVSKVVRRTTAADLYASLAGPSRGEQPEAGGE